MQRGNLISHRRSLACSGRARDVLDFIDAEAERERKRREAPLVYPFPLSGTFVASLQLPARGLRRSEAERLKLYVDALVTETDA